MKDSLILSENLVALGEALKKECPEDDCMLYQTVYGIYCELFEDYQKITQTMKELNDCTIRYLEIAIEQSELELYKMWEDNYAVLKYRESNNM